MTKEQLPVIQPEPQPSPQCGWNSWGACLAPTDRPKPKKALVGTLDPCPNEGDISGPEGWVCVAFGLDAQMQCNGYRVRTFEDDARDDAG